MISAVLLGFNLRQVRFKSLIFIVIMQLAVLDTEVT